VQLIFGFDIGTTSIGFAVVEYERTISRGCIKRTGVRIFPEPRNPKNKIPLNQKRRMARLHRRQLRRRRQRKAEVFRLLHESGFLPSRDSEEWQELMRGRTKENEDPYDPYVLRARAIDPAEKLTEFEIGRALYHLAGRRHFLAKSVQEEDTGIEAQQDEDEKEARSNREQTLRQLEEQGLTLGQLLSKRGPHERKRGAHATRQKVREEFDLIIEAQKNHHPPLGNPKFSSVLQQSIFFQRPVFWRKNTLGTCSLLPEASLCPKGSWLSHQRRMLEKLNNLEIAGGNQRRLDSEERAAILETLQARSSMRWAEVRRALAPLYRNRGEAGAEKTLKFNLEIGKEKSLLGNALEFQLVKVFGEDWNHHPRRDELRNAVHERLWKADYNERGERVEIVPDGLREEAREAAALSLQRDFLLGDDHVKQLMQLKLAPGWEPYSTQALQKILPLLQRGERFGAIINGADFEEWREQTFPNRDQPTGEVMNLLPSPSDKMEQSRLNNLRNPTVIRIQNELRKVTNNLIRRYGKPDLIRVELARDVGLSKRDREEMHAGMKRMEARRNKAKIELNDCGVDSNKRNIEKWMLWDECGRQCPYTGQMISFDDLFRTGMFEVEHIWPRQRSVDDSFMNKTLCHRDENRRKQDRIPDEYLNEDEMAALRQRLDGCQRTKANPSGMTAGKIKRFLAKSIPDDFASRQLNDTSYAARETVASLKRLWPDIGPGAPVKVQTVSGKVTAKLRKFWGLNNILGLDGEKNREDHRHHAVDALVVALTHPGVTQVLSHYWRSEREQVPETRIVPPLPDLIAQTKNAVNKIVVSHRIQRKVSGPLHEETVFGETDEVEISHKKEYRLYVTRKPLESLGAGSFGNGDGRIRDPQLRKRLEVWNKDRGGVPKKAFVAPPFPARGKDGVRIQKVRVLNRRLPSLMTNRSTGLSESGLVHHIIIWRNSEGAVKFDAVSLGVAAERKARREPIVQRNGLTNAQFLMSLSKKEALRISGDIFIVESIWSNGQVVLIDHRDAKEKPDATQKTVGSLIKLGAEKISIDPIGIVHPASD